MVDAVVPRMDWSPLTNLYKTYQDAYDSAQAPQLYASLFGLTQPQQQPSLTSLLQAGHERTGGAPLDRPPPPPTMVGLPSAQIAATNNPNTPSGRPAFNGNYMDNVISAIPQGEGPNQGVNVAQDFGSRFSAAYGAAPPAARPVSAAPVKATKAGDGMTVIDSPVTAGMPPNLRAALPAMLANPKTQATAMALASKYINPEQYELLKDGIGNVYSRNKQTNETKPVFNVSSGIQEAAASGGRTPLEYETAKQFSGAAAKNTELTPEQKVARESGAPTTQQYVQNQEEYKARLEGDKTAFGDFTKKYIAGQSAAPVLDEMINIATKTPGGWAGAVSPTLARAVSAFGVEVTPGMSNAELFSALNRQLIPAVRDPGASSNYEQQLYQQANPALNQSPEGRLKIARMLKAQIERNAEIYQAYRQNIGRGDLPEKLAAIRAKPLFDPADVAAAEKAIKERGGQLPEPPAPRIHSKTDYDQLPKGQKYVSPDGQLRTKQ